MLNHINAGIAGLFYGVTIPNHYATAHNEIHHRWHNDTGDVHTNMDLDRTLFYSYILSICHDFWDIAGPDARLQFLFTRRIYTITTIALWHDVLLYMEWTCLVQMCGVSFYTAYTLYPFLESASFLGMIAYLWHAFSEEADPPINYQ